MINVYKGADKYNDEEFDTLREDLEERLSGYKENIPTEEAKISEKYLDMLAGAAAEAKGEGKEMERILTDIEVGKRKGLTRDKLAQMLIKQIQEGSIDA